jgi:hypothetical protein
VQKWEDCPTVESDSIATSSNGKYISVCGLNKIKIFDTRMKSDDYLFDNSDQNDARIYQAKFIPDST